MKQSNVSIQSAFYLVGAVFLLTFLQGCGFCHGIFTFCNEIEQTPITAASGEPPAVVFEDPGIIKVMHGSGCAHLDKGGGISFTLEQSIDIPAYATKAAVFLNGWKLKYSGGDHHVAALAAAIGKIKLEPGKLTWNAVGVLEDYPGLFGHDKAIDWCDWYTVVAWNDTNLHAFVDQGDAEYFCKSGGMPSGSDNFFFAWNWLMRAFLPAQAWRFCREDSDFGGGVEIITCSKSRTIWNTVKNSSSLGNTRKRVDTN